MTRNFGSTDSNGRRVQIRLLASWALGAICWAGLTSSSSALAGEPTAPPTTVVAPTPTGGTSARSAEADAGLTEEVVLPVLIHFEEASYPPEELRLRREGRVVLTLDVDAEGHVIDASVVETAGAAFDQAARAAVLMFGFSPARRGETPFASRISYVYEFQLPALREVVPAPVTDVAPGPVVPAVVAQTTAAPAPLEGDQVPPPAPLPPVSEVTVHGKSRAHSLRESSQAIKVIETDVARRHTADIGEVLARNEGIAVQRSGGLGSSSRISLHGLTDDQIRLFVGGVPLEFSGFGLGLATVPLLWVDRVEVYRGVVPPRLGADALGGAIDVVTRDDVQSSNAAFSYAAGAFDTHQLALNAQTIHAPWGLLARASGFYDTSANDYRIRVTVPNAQGELHDATAHRSHDKYEGGGGHVDVVL